MLVVYAHSNTFHNGNQNLAKLLFSHLMSIGSYIIEKVLCINIYPSRGSSFLSIEMFMTIQLF